MSVFVIGVDPGQTTGVCVLDDFGVYRDLLQCSPGLVLPVVRGLLDGHNPAPSGAVLAVERFVVGRRAARSSTPAAGALTRELVVALTELGRSLGLRVALRSAAEVKPWATNARLDAAGLLALGKGMPHALDGGRHALFAAVADCGLPDPLSSRNRSRGDA